jgi:Ricin-type beta-trefoil lectin domain
MRTMHRVAVLLSACGLALALVMAGSGAAQAAVTPPSSPGWAEFFLPLLAGSNCLDVPGGSNTPGAPLQIFHCHGYASDGAPQRWQSQLLPGGGYEIFNQVTDLCITPTGASSGSRIVQQPCGTFPGQGWNLVDDPRAPNDLFQLVNTTYANMCLYGSAGNHGVVDMGFCSAASQDVWELG